jgi:crossover junction endodeoxyribonuclease RuvC
MSETPVRIIGLDPGLRHTGWGIITMKGSQLKPVAAGVIHVSDKQTLAERLKCLHVELQEILQQFQPEQAAVEETFSNTNAQSTLKLGMARGVVMAAPALQDIPVYEYAANVVKKTVVGSGHAAKEQIQLMIKNLLPTLPVDSADANDALAVAICHAHHIPMLRLRKQVKNGEAA